MALEGYPAVECHCGFTVRDDLPYDKLDRPEDHNDYMGTNSRDWLCISAVAAYFLAAWITALIVFLLKSAARVVSHVFSFIIWLQEF